MIWPLLSPHQSGNRNSPLNRNNPLNRSSLNRDTTVFPLSCQALCAKVFYTWPVWHFSFCKTSAAVLVLKLPRASTRLTSPTSSSTCSVWWLTPLTRRVSPCTPPFSPTCSPWWRREKSPSFSTQTSPTEQLLQVTCSIKTRKGQFAAPPSSPLGCVRP